jgi:hypothetical protein
MMIAGCRYDWNCIVNKAYIANRAITKSRKHTVRRTQRSAAARPPNSIDQLLARLGFKVGLTNSIQESIFFFQLASATSVPESGDMVASTERP